jgi:hypothetical protein
VAIRYTHIDINNCIKEYLAGKSIKQLSVDNGVSRQVFYRIFRENDIPIRNRSASMFTRMAQTSPEERKRLAFAANEAKRGLANTPEMLEKRAKAGKRFIGMFEQEFIDAISSCGIKCSPQEPFMSYNLDIGCGDIAVEIHTQTASPLSPRFLPKLMNCVNSGKSMIYVWINPTKNILLPECYDNVISILQEFCTNPPIRSKYWVIRGTGELYATGSFD